MQRAREGGRVSPLSDVARLLRTDPEWSEHARALTERETPGHSVHLAVFVQPFLDLVLSGKKTVESRFSVVRFPPYGQVARGDLVLLKESGGPVVGVCEVGAAWFYRLDVESWRTIRREFARAICAENPEFWRARERAEFATLMYVTRAKRLPPVRWPKRDRRGWVIVRTAHGGQPFGGSMRNTVFAFSGEIASGKSTLSEAVAQSLGCPRVSFGNYIRAEATRLGLPDDRRTLQDIGRELVVKDPEGLCRGVLAQAGWIPGGTLIVDGVRHVEIAEVLRRLVSPSVFRLVHVAASASVRSERLVSRGENAVDLQVFDAHSTERDVRDRLRELSDLQVDGEQPLEVAIEEVSRWAVALP